MSEPSEKEVVVEEKDASGKLTKRIIQKSNDQQSSIELNFDRNGIPAAKVKVYEDNPELMDRRLGEFLNVAKKHNKPLV